MRRHIGVICAYILISLVLFSPALGSFSQDLIFGGGDNQFLFWAQWHTSKQLESGFDIYSTCYAAYPDCTTAALQSLSVFNALMAHVFRAIMSPVAVFNLLYFIAIVLSFMGAYLLIFHVTKNVWPAFIGGLMFGLSPYHMTHSVLNLFSIYGIPFVLLFLLKLKEKPCWKYALGIALWLTIQTLLSWYMGLMTVLLILFFYSYVLIQDRRLPWKFILYSAVFCIVFIALILPFAIPLMKASADVTYKRDIVATAWFTSDVGALIVPPSSHPLFGSAVAPLYGNTLLEKDFAFSIGGSYYIGFFAIALLLYAWRRVRIPKFWIAMAIVFFILSLGSVLHIFGIVQIPVPFDLTPLVSSVVGDIPPQAATFFEGSIVVPLPYVLMNYIPIFQGLRAPDRLFVFVTLALAMIIAIIVKDILAKLSKKQRVIFIILLLALISFEYMPSTNAVPFEVHPYYSVLAEEEGDFAILELPQAYRAELSYYFAQTVHEKKLVANIIGRVPLETFTFTKTNEVMKALNFPLEYEGQDIPSNEFQELVELDIRYIIFHHNLPDYKYKGQGGKKENEIIFRQILDNHFSVVYRDEEIVVYKTEGFK